MVSHFQKQKKPAKKKWRNSSRQSPGIKTDLKAVNKTKSEILGSFDYLLKSYIPQALLINFPEACGQQLWKEVDGRLDSVQESLSYKL